MARGPSERTTWWDRADEASWVSRAVVAPDLASGAEEGLASGGALWGSGG
jgi:hypothetical protein